MATAENSPNIIVRLRKTRVFECVVNVTGYLEGELKDWPANIQDGIYAAMENVLLKHDVKRVVVVSSRCGRDEPTDPWHLVVVIAETLTGPEAYEVVRTHEPDKDKHDTDKPETDFGS
jgi:hypothetical protein